MLFNSLSYVAFLPIVFIIYWLIPHKYRWFLLLIASYYFYMSWNAKYLILILFTTIVSYGSAIILDKVKDDKWEKAIVVMAIAMNILVLFFFKYFNFMSLTVTQILSLFSVKISTITFDILLPVGISFYTFQTIGYVIDVYRGKIHAERHFGIYATFISFFPQLVAGPIERTENLLPQIKNEHRFNYNKAIDGVKLMIWGYYKKLIIADNISSIVDTVYGNLNEYVGFDLILAIFLFSVQIYCDFSGYSDIAIGTAKLLDIDLMTNFRAPYFSASIKEFWSRWHISLSTWFKDYLYIPMGGSRCSKARHYMNIFITFLVSGMWHGASWSFVFWGGIHGIAQITENVVNRGLNKIKNSKMGHIICIFFTFCFISLAWVPFRAEEITDVAYILKHAFDNILNPFVFFTSNIISPAQLILIIAIIIILIIHDYSTIKICTQDRLSSIYQNKVLSWLLYIFLGLIIVFGSKKGIVAEFVYFQF